MQAVKNIEDVMPKFNALESRHQQYYRQAVGSKLSEFVEIKTLGISVHRELFKKADFAKVLLDSMGSLIFEKDSYSEIRDVVTTIVHNHTNAATPMDVDTHIVSIEKEKSHGESAENEDTAASSTATKTRKANPHASGEISEGRSQTKGKWKVKVKVRRSMLQLRADGAPKQRLLE